jgi:hypothetical protein
MKINSKALDGSGKSIEEIQHEGLSVKGDVYSNVADTVITSTLFSEEGLYLVKNSTDSDSAVVSIINSGGTLSAVKVSGSDDITIAVGTAAKVNVYVLAGVLAVQNLTGGAIDITIKAYV